MDVKSKIEEIAAKLAQDQTLLAQFQKDPIKAVERLLDVDLPDELIEQIVQGVKGKISLDKVASAADALKKFF